MCGFVGVFSFSSSPVDEKILSHMRDAMVHRGPDDAGIFLSEGKTLGLGFRRLAILDLSEAGHQPMQDASGRYTIVFNGEIYNFMELRSELEQGGAQFKSRSDTEVLLKLFEREGPAMLKKLRGMFAMAIWDSKEKKIFLARDRVGKKPLYWANIKGRFFFASEIKAILKHPGVPREVNEEGLFHFLTFRTTPAPLTLFEGINKLPCGHWMSVDSAGRINLHEYWNAASAVKPVPGKCAEDFADGLVARLRESIKYRMVSDVPFGVFLSGGMDSTANTALMSELMTRPVETFTIGYDGEDAKYSELAWARKAARQYKTNSHEVILRDKDLVDFLPQLIHHQDEPIADPVCVPVYAVSKLARENGVIVCQVGEGSDEIFAGYPDWLQTLSLYDRRQSAWLGLTGPVMSTMMPVAASVGHRYSRWNQFQRFLTGEEIFWSGTDTFSEHSKKRLLSSNLRQRFKGFSSWEAVKPIWERYKKDSCYQHPLQWMAISDLNLRLPELLLMRVDKMSMANSVETRAPFLDHEFIEYALGIPPDIRIEGGRNKEVLRKALNGVVPQDILDRPKQGFSVPVKEWFWKALGDEAFPAVEKFAKNTDYFDRGELQGWMNQRNDYSWCLLNFALWHEHWIG